MPVLFIDPGSLSHELLLEQAAIALDPTGELTEAWHEVASLWAQLEPMGPGFRLFGEQELGEMTHRITLRARSDISATMRLRKGERVFQIVTLHDPDETGRYLVARVREEIP